MLKSVVAVAHDEDQRRRRRHHQDHHLSREQERKDDEIVRVARAKVGLLADCVWKPLGPEDPYRELNRRLWAKSCKIAANCAVQTGGTRYHQNRRRVRDVIPNSRLASYGDFEYQEDEASLLGFLDFDDHDEGEDETCDVRLESQRDHRDENTTNGRKEDDDEEEEEREPWMLDEVQDYFARVVDGKDSWRNKKESLSRRDETSRDTRGVDNHSTSAAEHKGKPPTKETTDNYEPSALYTITNVSEAQLEGRIFNEAMRNLWRSPSPQPQAQLQLQQQQQQQLTRSLQRELNLLRPSQPLKRTHTPTSSSADIQQTHSNFQNERLRMPNRCHYSYVQAINMVHRPLAPLCVDVPEFFPKPPTTTWPVMEDQTKPQLQYYTTTNENPYQDDLFPYKGHVASRKAIAVYQNTLVPMVPAPIMSTMIWPAHTWAQRIMPTPITLHPIPAPTLPPPAPLQAPAYPTVMHRPIRIQEPPIPAAPTKPVSQQSTHKPQIQAYQQRPSSNSSSKSSQDYSNNSNTSSNNNNQRRKNQGVDFSNLILLTKSAMKVRKNQVRGSKKSFEQQKAMAVAGKGDGSTVTRWFDKAYQQKRERDFVTVPTTTSRFTFPKPLSHSYPQDQTDDAGSSGRLSEDELVPTTSRKRLYRDVLESSSSPSASPVTLDSNFQEDGNFERRYDELERQAMEQYRTSEECLALRYQELEQQAMEQYRNASSSESINLPPENRLTNYQNDDDNDEDVTNAIVEDDINPVRRVSPSGFGNYNLARRSPAVDERGNAPPEHRIKILKPSEVKRRTTTAADIVQRASSEGCLRPIAVAKRLAGVCSSINRGNLSRDSKNTFRGASDDKIVKTSSLSSLKRRLIPMSPLSNTKSGGLIRNSNMNIDPIKAVQTLDKHVASYYRSNTKVIQTTGSGDAVNNTGVWLSDFWS